MTEQSPRDLASAPLGTAAPEQQTTASDSRGYRLPTSRAEGIRLLLIEFVTPERWVYDSRYFPYVQGFAERLGIHAQWLCFGNRFLTVKTGPAQVRQYMHLEGDDLSTLARHLSELRPTHVIVSHPITPAVTQCIGDNACHPRLLSMADLPVGEGCERFQDIFGTSFQRTPIERLGSAGPSFDHGSAPWQLGRTDWLLDWLGIGPHESEDRGTYLVGYVVPSYRVIMANAAARGHRPHLLLMGGLSCDYFGRVQENPLYSELDLSSCGQDYGCAYCTWYRGPTSQLNADPVRLAEEQLRRIVETGGLEGRYCGAIDAHDIRLFRRAERFFSMVLRLQLPPTTFYFEPRVDRFLEVAPKLDAILPDLARAGHRICLFRMGAENLVEEENELFNKHISLAQIDEAALRLQELARNHPTSFEYDPTYGYITCSPWTTLEMLELGIQRALERGFDPKGVWLYTPILFYQGSPITQLAMRDNLVTDTFEDLAPLYEPSVNQVSFESFVAWRFQDERTGVAMALIVRFCAASLRDKYPDTIFEGDSLYIDLLESGAVSGFHRPDQFALAVLSTIKASRAPYDKHGILHQALQSYAQNTDVREPSDAAQPPSPHEGLTFLLGASRDRLASRLADIGVGEVRFEERSKRIELRLNIGPRPCELVLCDRRTTSEHLFRTERFNVCFRGDSPFRTAQELDRVRLLVEMFDRALAAYAPHIPG